MDNLSAFQLKVFYGIFQIQKIKQNKLRNFGSHVLQRHMKNFKRSCLALSMI